jgi:diguanylate cyclase (GGDEF)-like protein
MIMLPATLNIDLNGLELLIVEDDATSALFISRALSKHGARVETANCGSDGYQKFLEKRYPIVITDINMPGMSGLELASHIKALDKETQIIATSAISETDCLVSAISLGFTDYFIKPVEFEKLILAVKRCSDVITARQQLENEREKFRTVLECLNEGISIKDLDFKILYQNSAMTKLFGDRVGSPCYAIFDLDEPCPDCPTVKSLSDGQAHSACRDYRHNDITSHIERSASLLRDANGTVTGTVEIFRDISERVALEQDVREMAFLDPLTGLSNRRLFEDRLEQAVANANRYRMKFGLLYMDLDHFKVINDTFGHETGDQVLVEASRRINSCCKRDLDTISRLGGDEFCIILTDCGDRDQLTAIAQKLLLQFERPFRLGNSLAEITTSIGISIYPDNGSVMKELEIAADRAMYAAKKAGRNTFRFWEPYANPGTDENKPTNVN